MQWSLRSTEGNPLDPHGLGGFLKRLEQNLGLPIGQLGGFTFLKDGQDMLRISRIIEHAVLEAGAPGPLYTGFQNAAKFAGEAARYRALRDRGVQVIGFGEDEIAPEVADLVSEWCVLPADRGLLENQWFLVTETPSPVAFIGWELSPASLRGRGGISMIGKEFAGFASDDPRVVSSLISHLEDVRHSTNLVVSPRPQEIGEVFERLQPSKVLVLVDDGKRPFLQRGLPEVLAGAIAVGAEIYAYDLSSASYLVSPYSDDEDRLKRPLSGTALRTLGWPSAAGLIDRVEAMGGRAWGLLPYDVGFKHLSRWCEAESIDLVVLPVEYTRPGLFDRLQGYTMGNLRQTAGFTTVVNDPERGPWLVTTPEHTRALPS